MRKLVLAGLSAGALFAAPVVGMTAAHAANTIVVDDDGAASATDCNADGTAYPTIQAGVNAALAGDIIKVCPGVYTGDVVVNKMLTINGPKAGGSPSRTNSANAEAHVTGTTADGTFQLNASDIVLNGFLIEGNQFGPGVYTSPSYSGYQVRSNLVRNNVSGLHLNSAATGGQTVVQSNQFQTNNFPGTNSGDGLYADQGLYNAVVKNNRLLNNNDGNITLYSGADASVDNRNVLFTRNTSVDGPAFVTVFQGHNVRIANNTVANVTQDATGGSAIFVGNESGAEVSGVTVANNTITKADYSGVAVRNVADNVTVTHNTVDRAGNNGIDVSTTVNGAVTVTSNKVTNSMANGIFFGAATSNNTILSNTATGNGTSGDGSVDCRDSSAGSNRTGVANYWATSNVGVTSFPAGLCKPPVG